MKRLGIFITIATLNLPLLSGCATSTSGGSTSSKHFTVTWKNWDGTILEVDENVPYGAMASYDSDDPTRAEDNDYVYAWDGEWSAPVSYVYSDMTFTAKFTKKEKIYLTSDNRKSFFELSVQATPVASSATILNGYTHYTKFNINIKTINIDDSYFYYGCSYDFVLSIYYTEMDRIVDTDGTVYTPEVQSCYSESYKIELNNSGYGSLNLTDQEMYLGGTITFRKFASFEIVHVYDKLTGYVLAK